MKNIYFIAALVLLTAMAMPADNTWAEKLVRVINPVLSPMIQPYNTVKFILLNPEKKDIKLDIYNFKQKHIITIQIKGGGELIKWDGKDKNGNNAGSENYLYFLTIGEKARFSGIITVAY